MTSKLRFLCDATGDVYVKCFFSQLSSSSSTLLGPWKPYPGGIDHPLRSLLDTSQQNENRPTSTVQLLTKKRSIFLSLKRNSRTFDVFLYVIIHLSSLKCFHLRGRLSKGSSSENLMKSINITRGLFRLWIVVSTLWVMLAISGGILTDEPFYGFLVAIIPPPIVFTLGIALVWALKGFNPSQPFPVSDSYPATNREYRKMSRRDAIAIAAVFCIYLVFVLNPEFPPKSIGEMLGGLLVHGGLVFWLALRGLKLSRVVGIIAVFMLLGALVGAGRASFENQKLAMLVSIGRDAYSEQEQIDDDYQKDVEKLELRTVFLPQTIGRPGGLEHARSVISAAKNATERAKARSAEVRNEVQQKVVTVGLNSRDAARFKESFDNTNEITDEFWRLEQKILTQVEKMVGFLSDKSNRWLIERQQIVFQDKSTLVSYAALVAELEELQKHEELLNQTLNARRKQGLEVMTGSALQKRPLLD